ncbi:MAG: GntR family transcriptional regulator [Bacteroidales bacterium]|nr:GntR family transcriptional regulator [Bacteroidales bacterium]
MSNKIAKYISISEEIINSIESGEYQPGEKVPSETEIISTYKVSNTTARKSLLEIELKGWAIRIKGKGTFVLNRSEDVHLTRTLGSIYTTREGFDEKLIMEGFKPRNVILEKEVINAGISAEISGHHYIIEGKVVRIHRLRYADDILMKDETRYISLTKCPKINMLESTKSFFAIYEQVYSLELEGIKQTLSTTIFNPDTTGNYFESAIPLPVFILDSAVFCKDGAVVEIEKSFYRGDKYKFSVISNPEI